PAGSSRVFNISSGHTVRISGLTISQGQVSGVGAAGGGIFNSGTLTVTSCAIRENRAISGGGVFSAAGSTLTISNSLVANNTAPFAAALRCESANEAVLANVTVSGNISDGAASGVIEAGSQGTSGGRIRLDFCT